MTPEETRALIAEAETHQELVTCGNPQHTNFEVGCPECAVVCDYCTCPWPCDARRLADALSALTVPDGDARERLAEIIEPYIDTAIGDYGSGSYDETLPDAILAAFPVLGTAAPEPEEWEYICQTDAPTANHLTAFSESLDRARKTQAQRNLMGHTNSRIWRRRKAGPWEPLPVGGES